jgi:5,6-dimethylbenzimidazole synthase
VTPERQVSETPPVFDAAFQDGLEQLLRWRRDVRRFRDAPVPPALIDELLDLACLAPSVGNSQPWRFVAVESPTARKSIRDNFEAANAEALSGYCGEQAELYAGLKLSGLDKAPVHLAVFCDQETLQGHGLGRQTMPETLRYSAILAVHTFWLTARTRGLGCGWVSILDPKQATTDLKVPENWTLVAYLCIGWPEEEHHDPELVRHGWQDRTAECRKLEKR